MALILAMPLNIISKASAVQSLSVSKVKVATASAGALSVAYISGILSGPNVAPLHIAMVMVLREIGKLSHPSLRVSVSVGLEEYDEDDDFLENKLKAGITLVIGV